MGPIIKPICVCECVCPFLRISRSHFLIDFHQNWRRSKTIKVRMSSLGSISHHPFPILPLKHRFGPRGKGKPITGVTGQSPSVAEAKICVAHGCPVDIAILTQALKCNAVCFAVTAKPKLALCTAARAPKPQCCCPPSNISGDSAPPAPCLCPCQEVLKIHANTNKPIFACLECLRIAEFLAFYRI